MPLILWFLERSVAKLQPLIIIFKRIFYYMHATFILFCSVLLFYFSWPSSELCIRGFETLYTKKNHKMCCCRSFIFCKTRSIHSSEIRSLRSTKCSSEMLQKLLYFMCKKTYVVFFVFHFVQLYIFTLWMPWSMST